MLRQNQRFFTQLYMLCDMLCTLVVFLFAYWLKFKSQWLESTHSLPFTTYLIWGTVYSFSSIVIGFYLQFYTPKRRRSYSQDFWKIIQIQSFSLLGLLGLLYFAKENDISRQLLLIFYGLNIVCIAVYRYIVKNVLFSMRRKGYNKKYVLIIGAGKLGRSFYFNLGKYPEIGYDACGFLDDKLTEHDAEYRQLPPILGKVDDLEQMLQKHDVDEVIVALPLDAHHKLPNIINICENAGIKVLIIPDYFDLLPARPFFDNFAGIPLINVRDVPLDELGNRILKRSFDIVFSIFAIILTSPIWLFAIIGIKLTSPGPVIFKQERVGLNRKTFQMYKFRSMHVSPPEVADTQWTVKDDPRRTRFGSFLRRTNIDELPQFINVLLGHMSVVGPRPERPYFVNQFKDEIPKYMVKHQIRPGITGWAQSNGLRGDTSIQERIFHDIFYIENWSFFLDIKIIFMTAFRRKVNQNAY